MIKDYKSIFSPKFHSMVIILVVFQFFLWNTFLTVLDFYATALLFELMIVGIPLTTEYYKRYNQDFFLKSNQLQDRSKKELQLMLFIIVFVDMCIVVFYHISINYLFQEVFNLATENVAGTVLLIKYDLFNDINIWLPFFMFIFFLIMSIIAMSYFLNHFIKNKMFIYGMIIVFMAIEIIFGPLLNWHLFDRIKVDGVWYINNGDYFSPVLTKISLILIPWNYFAFMINLILRRAEWIVDMPIANFWDNTYFEEGLKFLIWYPYVIMGLYFIIPRISKESFVKKVTYIRRALVTN